MTPYYSEPGISIFHGDCGEILPEMPDSDLVLTDPPYVFGIASTEGKAGWGDLMNSAVWYQSWMVECKRLTQNKPGSMWVFNSWRSFPVLARAAYLTRWPIKSLVVWDKDWIGPGVNGLRPQYELIALFQHDGCSIKDRGIGDVWKFQWMSSIGVTEHRAEKPIALMERVIKLTEAATVIDPFMGSGTTLVAAKNVGCRAIGIEIEERYCEIAANRLRQGVLWGAQ